MPIQNTAPAMGAIRPDPNHAIDLLHGHFQDTTPKDLAHAFVEFAHSGTAHLCVFFHGGLVSREEGLKTARELEPRFAAAGTYPFFFIWNSSLLTELEKLLKPKQDDPRFVKAANRACNVVGRKIAAALGADSAHHRTKAWEPMRGTATDLQSLSKKAIPYDRAWAREDGAQLSVSRREMEEFANALVGLSGTLPRKDRLFLARKLHGRRNPLARIIQRFNTGHDHGLYTTVVEELLIATPIGNLAEKVWEAMKSDVDRAFEANSNAGGSAFLDQLLATWNANPSLRLTLIGHSAGGIYVQRFIEALDARLASDAKNQVNVITLAAALSFDRMSEGLEAWRRRVQALRVFGLSDALESGYWQVPFVYDKSLLYLVSSICERNPEADQPLVGMQRYWSGKPPYAQPTLRALVDFINPARSVWSPTKAGAEPGYRTQATEHGGFAVEPVTEESMVYILEKAFTAI